MDISEDTWLCEGEEEDSVPESGFREAAQELREADSNEWDLNESE